MTLPESSWVRYIDVLSAISDTAGKKFTAYLNTHEIDSQAGRKAAIDYAVALAEKYGESAAAMACEMYDATAAASGAFLPAAEPAAAATYGDVAKTVNGMAKQRQSNDNMGAALGRLVKRTGVDTTMKNAIRDGAEWAWVPHGDTCAFCIMLASNGWQRASKKALKGGHAEHIHSNCDCTYAVRFDGKSKVAGYDPDKYREMYENADGDTWQEKLNSMRRDQYAEDGDRIRAQKRAAYFERRQILGEPNTTEAIGNTRKNIIDYSDARSFAGDNIRLQNMLRSQDARQISEAVDAILEDSYSLPKSAWNGKTDVLPDGSLGKNVLGKAQWNGTIAICDSSKNDLSVHIHEQLHMRSISRYGETKGRQLLFLHKGVEEGTIELLTQEICRNKNISSSERYPNYVDELRFIRRVTLPRENDLSFAIKLIDIPVEERYTYLEKLVSDYTTSNEKTRESVVTRLDKALKELRR